jgi:hypothetical protein
VLKHNQTWWYFLYRTLWKTSGIIPNYRDSEINDVLLIMCHVGGSHSFMFHIHNPEQSHNCKWQNLILFKYISTSKIFTAYTEFQYSYSHNTEIWLFTTAISTAEIRVLNKRGDHERYEGNGFEGGDHGLSENTIPAFAWTDWGK